ELDVAHSRIAKCQRKQIEMMVEKVSEVRPVELALLARRGLKAHESSFPFFDSPAREQVANPGVASWISALLNFQEQLVRVVHTLLPPLAKVVTIGIHLARSECTRRISLRWPMQKLADGLAIQIQSLRDLALAQTKLMQLLNVHPFLQVNHRPPPADGRSAQDPIGPGTTLRIFQSAILGIFILALTPFRQATVRPYFRPFHPA